MRGFHIFYLPRLGHTARRWRKAANTEFKTMIHTETRHGAKAVAIAVIALLAACGGGGVGADVSPGGPVSQPPEAEVADPPEIEPEAPDPDPEAPRSPETETLPNRPQDPEGQPEIDSPIIIGDPIQPIPSLCDQFPSLSQCQEDGDADETVSLSGPATLAVHGSYRTGTATYEQTSTSVCVPVPCANRFPGTFQGTRTSYRYSEWGFWARVGEATLFRADIRRPSFDNDRHVEGSRSGTRPTGAATWTGHVRAYEAHPDTYGTPVEGTASLSVDFGGSTLSADLTGVSRGHRDLSWSSVRIGRRGEFSQGPDRSTTPAISGAFYGAEHQGVAGRFSSAALDGVFGAVR